MTEWQVQTWLADRERQAGQHPGPAVRSRGDHYRRKNTGIALRTFRSIVGRGCCERDATGRCLGNCGRAGHRAAVSK